MGIDATVTLVLSILSATGLLSLVVKDIYHSIKNGTKKAIEKNRSEKKAQLKEVMQEETKTLHDKLDGISNKLDQNTTGTVTLLRDRMKAALDSCKEKGYAGASDRANWMELYNSYRDLGGNHFREYVDQWKEELNSLPINK